MGKENKRPVTLIREMRIFLCNYDASTDLVVVPCNVHIAQLLGQVYLSCNTKASISPFFSVRYEEAFLIKNPASKSPAKD